MQELMMTEQVFSFVKYPNIQQKKKGKLDIQEILEELDTGISIGEIQDILLLEQEENLTPIGKWLLKEYKAYRSGKQLEYYYKNRDKILDHLRRYRLEHKQIVKDYEKRYRETRKEKIKEYNFNYHSKNKEKCRAILKEWRKNNRDKLRAQKRRYYQKHRERELLKQKQRKNGYHSQELSN